MVVVASASSLPQFLEGLRHPDLRWAARDGHPVQHGTGQVGPAPLRQPAPAAGAGLREAGQFSARRRRRRYRRAAARSNSPEGQEQWHPVEVGMSMIVERFTRPGQVVCDPFLLGWRGTAHWGPGGTAASSSAANRDKVLP